MSVSVGSATGYLDLDISGFLAGLQSAQTQANTQTKNMAQQIGSNISAAGEKLSSVGKDLTTKVTLPIVGAGTAIVKLSANFESAMSKVSAISGATGSDLEALNAKAQEMGAKTKFSATEAAEAFTYMAMAGWKTEAMLDGIDGIMNLAAADGLDLATTSDIVTDALTAFGMEAKDSAHFADVLAKAASSSNTNVSMLGESFKYVAPVAGALGFSAEDTAVALGLMANAGIKASQSGTALRGAFTRMIKPTDTAKKYMERYSLSMTNSDGSMKSLAEVMVMLRTNMGDLTEAEQAQAAATLFGQEAMSGMLAIINASDADFNKLTNEINNADGAAEKMATTMLDNLSGQITILKSALEGLSLQFGEILLPYIKKGVTLIQNLTAKLQALTSEQKEQIVKWAAIAAAIGPALIIVGKFTKGAGSLVTAFGKLAAGFTAVKSGGTAAAGILSKLGGAIAGITAPMIAIAAAVAAVIAAFVSLWKNNEEFRNKIIAIWNEIKGTWDRLVQGITDRLSALGFSFEGGTGTIKKIWEEFCNFLAPIFEGVFKFIADAFEVAVDVILGIVDFFTSVFKGDWEGAWNAVKEIFESVWNGVVATFRNICNTLVDVANVVLGWFGTDWNTAITEVSDFFKGIWQGISEFFTSMWQTIWNSIGPLFKEIAGAFQMAWDVIKLIWDYAQPYFAGIWEGIKAVFLIAAEWFKMIFGIAWEGIKAAWSFVVIWFTLLWENLKAVFAHAVEFFKGIFTVAWEVIKSVWNNVVAFFTMVWAGIKAVFAVVKGVLSGDFSDAWDAIKNLWDKVVNYFSTVWDGIKNVFGAVVSFFKDTFSSAWEAIKKVFSNFGSFFSSLWDIIKNTFVNLGTKIGDAIGGAVKAGINGIIGMIEGTINSFIGMINGAINLINLIPGVSLGKISTLKFPRLARGGVVDSATFAMIGEDGKEAVVPLEKNLGWMKNLVNEFMNRLGDFFDTKIKFSETFAQVNILLNDIREACQSILAVQRQFAMEGAGYIGYNGFVRTRNVNNQVQMPSQGVGEGDTFIFNSPKAIDEVEAARQMKKAKRDLAEGF